MATHPTLGTHVLLDCFDVQTGLLDSPELLVALLEDAASAADATVLSAHHHRFEPHGVSAMLILAESHISIHTWPENGHATVDVYTCGETAKPALAAEFILDALQPKHHQQLTIQRGSMRS